MRDSRHDPHDDRATGRRKLGTSARARQSAEHSPPAQQSIISRSGAYIEPERRHGLICEAAYYLAERRSFEPGHEMEDWLAAEAEIDRALAHGEFPTLPGQ